MAGNFQIVKSIYEIHRFCCVCFAQCFCHGNHAVINNTTFRPVGVVCFTKHNQTSAMFQFGIFAAERMFHSVFGSTSADAFAHAGKGVCQRHIFSCFLVAAVIHCFGKALADQFDGFESIKVVDGVGVAVDVTFGAVEQSVKSLISCQFFRYAHHQVRVNDGQYGECAVITETDFFAFGISDNSPRVCFCAGACCGGDGNDGQRSYGNSFAAAGTAGNIVPESAFVCCHNGNGFCGVDDGAAAQTNDEVTAFCFCQGCAFHNMVFCGVGLDFVENHMGYACLVQLFFQTCQIAVFPYGSTAGNDDQRFFAGQVLFMESVQLTAAEQHAGRDIILKFHK